MKQTVKIFSNLKIVFLLLAIVCATTASAQDSLNVQDTHRKKVGVVLSGGGAKGAAHVSALRLIEEAGIPIDVITGTSIGSIVAGLYANGYSCDQLDSLFRTQDWQLLLTNSSSRMDKSFAQREWEDKYILNARVSDRKNIIPGGILSGDAVMNLLNRLTSDLPDSIDFTTQLKIPYGCVAMDVVSGQEIDFVSGNLAKAIRASMSIPGVFEPVRTDQYVLVDGGAVNNYPVDLAKSLGADIIIGVTFKKNPRTVENVKNVADVLTALAADLSNKKFGGNVAQTDLQIDVDVHGLGAASFTEEAIDSLIVYGDVAARAKLPELIELRKSLGLPDTTLRQAGRGLPPSKQNDSRKPVRGGTLSVGARIDSEELASVMLGACYQSGRTLYPKVELNFRLGKRSYGRAALSLSPATNWLIGGSYRYSYYEMRLYHNGEHTTDLNYLEHLFHLGVSRYWHDMKAEIGAKFQSRRYDDLYSSFEWQMPITNKIENLLIYFADFKYDNQDSEVYPERGMKSGVRLEYLTDDGAHYGENHGLMQFGVHYEHAIPLGKGFTLMPSVYGRSIPSANTSLGNQNMIGGIGTMGHYISQQLPFAGIYRMQVVGNHLGIVGLTGRKRIGKNHNIFAVANYAKDANQLSRFLKETNRVGASLGYGYKTLVGPIEGQVSWSNTTSAVSFFLNIGFMF